MTEENFNRLAILALLFLAPFGMFQLLQMLIWLGIHYGVLTK